ncbi:hypothetical protein Pcinc_035589 [Petrolisthes cinctipes]|uniref:Leucine-rich PPR motif-containing protein, mitochondrial n=1 Tax=Petrolisthes cinctipes TaxID=88211 RepID=A0AAE1BXE3_PETCI|nr:hypothetical protein Pcinc_035589 [Petrolisthes cinctipes]
MVRWERILKYCNTLTRRTYVHPTLCTSGSINDTHTRTVTRSCEVLLDHTASTRDRSFLRVDASKTSYCCPAQNFSYHVLTIPYPASTTHYPSSSLSHSSIPNTSRSASTVSTPVEETFNTLKMKLDRLGRVSRSDLARAVGRLEPHQDQLSDGQCCWLMELAVRVARGEFRPCGKLLNRIWQLTLSRPNAQVTLEHIELYLEACQLTETPCTLKEMTEVLERHDLEVSGRVLGLLLAVAADMEAATAILAAMKERGVPASHDTFAQLLRVYASSGDESGVESVEEAMRSVKMERTSSTFVALTTGHAQAGHIAAVEQTIDQASRVGVAFSQGQLATVLFTLAKAGHAGDNFANLEWVIKLLVQNDVRQAEVELSHLALKLIHCGRPREAFHLVHHLPSLRTNTHLYTNATFYVQEAVRAHTDPEIVIEVCHGLEEEDISQFGVLVALETALRESRVQLAWTLLQALKERGVELREHYFWPLFHSAAGDTQTLLEYVKRMLGLGVSAGVETLRDHVLPELPSTPTNPSLVCRQLHNLGLFPNATATPMLATLIRKNAFDAAAKFVADTKTSFSLAELTPTLASAWPSSPRVITTLLATLITRHFQSEQRGSDHTQDTKKEDWGGQFLLDMAASRRGLGVTQINPLFQELNKNKIGVSELSLELVSERSNLVIQEAIRRSSGFVLDPALGSPPLEKEYNILPHPRKMNVEELGDHLVELDAKGLNQRGTIRRLILSQATTATTPDISTNTTSPPTTSDISAKSVMPTTTPAAPAPPSTSTSEAILGLAHRASGEGMKLSPGMISSVLKAQINSKDLDAARDTLTELHALHPTFHLDHYKVIDLCTLMVEEGQGAEAVKTLRQHLLVEVKNGTRDATKTYPKQIRRNCRNLLVASARTGDYSQTRDLLDLLLTRGLVTPDTLIMGALVKCRLASGDLAGAVKETEEIVEQHKCLPMAVETLINLIHSCGDDGRENKEGEAWTLVQRMVDIIASHSSTSHAHHTLLFACLEGNRPIFAARIFKNLKRKLNRQRIQKQVERYGQTQQTLPLLHLLAASSLAHAALSVTSRQHIYSTLLEIYAVQGEVDKGLALWTQLQEEDLPSSPAFLASLSDLLKAHGRAVPFQIK